MRFLRNRYLTRGAALLAAVAFVGLAVWAGKAWNDSRLPGSFNAMDIGVLDYGGGRPQNHGRHPHVGVDKITGPTEGEADFQITLTAAKTDDGWAFNGRVPGPELRVRQGDLVEVRLVNEDIDEGVTIHWHGVDVPNAEDGVAGVTQDAVMRGEEHTYRFNADQLGTFWYHSHQVSSTQVRRGLYGAFVIVPREPREPAPPNAIDETAIIHDFDGSPALNDQQGVERRTVEPGTPVRLRIVNSNGSPERVTLTGVPFRVVGIDGTDVNRPTPIEGRTIELGGGARYDLAFTMPEVAVRLGIVDGRAAYSFSADGETDLQPPPELPVFDPASYGEPRESVFGGRAFDRHIVMKIGKKLGFMNGRPGRHWSVNGKIFPDTPMYVVAEGEFVKMRIVNDTGAVHPMHLHGHHALVLTRNGKPTTGSPWWVDTLNVLPDEEYEIAFQADNPGLWMDHCHNLPHAADGLTMHVMYEGVSTPFRIGGDGENHPE